MKKSIIMLVFAAFVGFTANAQNQKTTTGNTTGSTATTTHAATTTTQTQAPKPAALKVPSAVESGFKAKYANVTSPSWSMKGADYQAKFKLTNEEMKADFDATGKWLQTETRIASTSLPSTVQTEIKKDFADYKTESACKIQSATTGSGYEAKVAKGTEKYSVVFGVDGKMISKTKV